MAHDEDLADRIRGLLDQAGTWSERRMFGGVAFLADGSLAVAASGQGGLLVRVDPGSTASLIASAGAEPAIMRGRELDGWVRVPADRVRTKRQLGVWVRRGTDRARSLR